MTLTRDIARLRRQKKWPKQMQWLYDYFQQAAEDPSARAEELLWCCSYGFFERLDREYVGLSDEAEELLTDLLEDGDWLGALETVHASHPEVWVELLEMATDSPELFFDQDSPEEQPAWTLMSMLSADYGWLVHFSDTADDIASEGFCRGVPRPDALALTTMLPSHEFDIEGYNFAYEIASVDRYGFRGGTPNYGKLAVVFRAPYLLFDHYTDQEPQAVFWGPSARDIVRVYLDGSGYPTLSLDESVLLDRDTDTVICQGAPEDWRRAGELEDEHENAEWVDDLEFKDFREMGEWLNDPRNQNLLDRLQKPKCVIEAKQRRRG